MRQYARPLLMMSLSVFSLPGAQERGVQSAGRRRRPPRAGGAGRRACCRSAPRGRQGQHRASPGCAALSPPPPSPPTLSPLPPRAPPSPEPRQTPLSPRPLRSPGARSPGACSPGVGPAEPSPGAMGRSRATDLGLGPFAPSAAPRRLEASDRCPAPSRPKSENTSRWERPGGFRAGGSKAAGSCGRRGWGPIPVFSGGGGRARTLGVPEGAGAWLPVAGGSLGWAQGARPLAP